MPDLAAYRRILLLTEGRLGVFSSKTAAVLLRYRADDIVAVIDSDHAGADIRKLLPFAPERPILPAIDAARDLNPDAVFVGIHPSGGTLPAAFRKHLLDALQAGIDVVSGLHTFIADDVELTGAARRSGATIIDVRRPPADRRVATGQATNTRARRVLTVGTDCNVGKMLTAVELTSAARNRGIDVRFIATGQTGIMLCGRGVPIDAIVSDFAAGAIEQAVVESGDAELCVVEGQGSLAHPGFSGVTLALLHGCCPDAMVLVHHAGRTHHRSEPREQLVSLERQWDAYERMAALRHPARIVAVALNTHASPPELVEEERRRIATKFGVPVADPVAEGVGPILDAIVASAQD